MAKENIDSKKGFTIIEVVLVLAIAGLIFLMVFIALPAMQRNQRDTQRRNDYSMLSSAITSYSSSNQGKLYRLAGASSASASSSKDLDSKSFINEEGTDPNGKTYALKAYTWAKWNTDMYNNANTKTGNEFFSSKNEVYVIIGADCNGLSGKGFSMPNSNSSSRAFAIFGYIESGSNTYCSSSQ